MANIKLPDGKIKTVKNLGWVLRNWSKIDRLEWIDMGGLTNARGQALVARGMIDGVFRAYMRDGSIYATTYASFQVWKGFIDRPVFRGLQVTVNGITGTI